MRIKLFDDTLEFFGSLWKSSKVGIVFLTIALAAISNAISYFLPGFYIILGSLIMIIGIYGMIQGPSYHKGVK